MPAADLLHPRVNPERRRRLLRHGGLRTADKGDVVRAPAAPGSPARRPRCCHPRTRQTRTIRADCACMGLDVTTVADGVHLAGTGLVNWVVLVEGDRVALVDGGYPRDLGAVEESVRRAGGRPEDVEAVLVTHAHVDHIGTLPELRRRYGVRVLTGEVEARHVRGEVRESATPHDVLLRSYRPRIAAWGCVLPWQEEPGTRLSTRSRPSRSGWLSTSRGRRLRSPSPAIPVATRRTSCRGWARSPSATLSSPAIPRRPAPDLNCCSTSSITTPPGCARRCGTWPRCRRTNSCRATASTSSDRSAGPSTRRWETEALRD